MISGLKSEIKGLKTELQSPDAPLTFDCYMSNDWSTDGIIRFDGCVADITTQDPWTGSFAIPTDGLWRFTFNAGRASFPDGAFGGIYLKVDGNTVAKSYTDPTSGGVSLFTMSLNTVQEVRVGQTVTIEWSGRNGAYIVDDSNYHHTHWTGEYLGPSTPAPPECQTVGQTFEYPGSCRNRDC